MGIPSERIRRFVTPIDPGGVGRVVDFMNRPNNDYDFGNGYDNRGRSSYFRYFRPAGMPQEIRYPYGGIGSVPRNYPYPYVTNSGLGQQYLMPVLLPAGSSTPQPGPARSKSDTRQQSLSRLPVDAVARDRTLGHVRRHAISRSPRWPPCRTTGTRMPSRERGPGRCPHGLPGRAQRLRQHLRPDANSARHRLGQSPGARRSTRTLPARPAASVNSFSGQHQQRPEFRLQREPLPATVRGRSAIGGYHGGDGHHALQRARRQRLRRRRRPQQGRGRRDEPLHLDPVRPALRAERPGMALPAPGRRRLHAQQPALEARPGQLPQPGRRPDPPPPVLDRLVGAEPVRLRQR